MENNDNKKLTPDQIDNERSEAFNLLDVPYKTKVTPKNKTSSTPLAPEATYSSPSKPDIPANKAAQTRKNNTLMSKTGWNKKPEGYTTNLTNNQKMDYDLPRFKNVSDKEKGEMFNEAYLKAQKESGPDAIIRRNNTKIALLENVLKNQNSSEDEKIDAEMGIEELMENNKMLGQPSARNAQNRNVERIAKTASDANIGKANRRVASNFSAINENSLFGSGQKVREQGWIDELESKKNLTKEEEAELKELKVKQRLPEGASDEEIQKQMKLDDEISKLKPDTPENAEKIRLYNRNEKINSEINKGASREEAEQRVAEQESLERTEQVRQDLMSQLQEAQKDPYTKEWADSQIEFINQQKMLSDKFPKIIPPQTAEGMAKQELANFQKIQQLKKAGKQKEAREAELRRKKINSTIKQVLFLSANVAARLLTILYIKGLNKI